MTTDTERCGKIRDYGIPQGAHSYPCVLAKGHAGTYHRDVDDDAWSEADPTEDVYWGVTGV